MRFSYVGSPWFKDWPWMDTSYKKNIKHERQSSSDEYSVEAWQNYWSGFDRAGKGDEATANASPTDQVDCSSYEAQVKNYQCPLPSQDKLSFPETLAPRQWVGNGGLSLRSRKWMVRMIRLCPRLVGSGLPLHVTKGAKCTVQAMQEDMFFSLLLTLVGAPIPNAQEASMFSVDQNFGWPAAVLDDDASSGMQEWLGNDAWSELQT
jgi:hypothetical protein